MNFSAKIKDNILSIEPVIEKINENIVVHVPSLDLINKFKNGGK